MRKWLQTKRKVIYELEEKTLKKLANKESIASLKSGED